MNKKALLRIGAVCSFFIAVGCITKAHSVGAAVAFAIIAFGLTVVSFIEE
jgi:hypothetical protein